MEKELKYFLTDKAHQGLAGLFAIASSITTHRRTHNANNNAMFDGYQVIVDAAPITSSLEGVSHNLNLFAAYYDLTDWIDNRSDQQLIQTQIPTHPVFHTIKEAHEYKQLNGLPDDLATWSDTPLFELVWDDITDQSTKSFTRRPYSYRLSPGSRQYYAALASFYKMRPPTTGRISITGRVAAVLEAIGTNWLLPPEDYLQLMSESPNRNKARPNRASRQAYRLKHGNILGTPFIPDLSDTKYQPFTPARAALLKQQMIANGELTL